MRIIVEVGEDVQSVGQVPRHLAGPDREGLVRVASTITDPVKPQVDPVGGDVLRMVVDQVMDAEAPL